MYGFREFADAGGLMSYGYNLPDAYRQMARLVAKIFKGDRSSDLPFERPARYELIVNLNPGFVRAARRRGDRIECCLLRCICRLWARNGRCAWQRTDLKENRNDNFSDWKGTRP
jgi:hypothetical protein